MLKKILVLLLSIVILTSTVPENVFASNSLKYPDSYNSTSVIYNKVETPYGTMYYVQERKDIVTYVSFWDVLDIAMAGASWADLFNEPSWSNFGWAILDTAALLPLLPSSAYVRKGGKILLKSDEFLKFAKTKSGAKAIKTAMKTYKLATVTYGTGQLQKKFKHAIDFGIKGSFNTKKALEFKTALSKVVSGATEIYKSSYRGSDIIIYIKDGLGVLTKLNGEFISGWKLTSEQLKFHRLQLKIK